MRAGSRFQLEALGRSVHGHDRSAQAQSGLAHHGGVHAFLTNGGQRGGHHGGHLVAPAFVHPVVQRASAQGTHPSLAQEA
mgnify:CR=1 FL=1